MKMDMKMKQKIYRLESKIIREASLDLAFPDRKNSKSEELKAELLNLERYAKLLEQGLEDQTYEDYKEEFMNQLGNTGLTGAIGIPGPSDKSKEDEIAELEAKLAALRG